MNQRIYTLFLFLFSFGLGFGQSGFTIEGGKKNFKLSFDPVNNLVIVPVELNGVQLSFLLDTGVDATVLFKLPESDSLILKDASRIWIRGMGLDKPVEGFKSEGNVMRIGKAVHENFTVYTVYEKHMELSLRMGLPIHGIIGYDFFKDFIVEFRNFKKIKVHDPEKYQYKKCRKCEEFELKFHKNKPYVSLLAKLNEANVSLNLLIDSGSGAALWLFENGKKQLKVPKDNFPDFLGHGFGGSIYGSKSRIKELNFGKFRLEEITTSFPDTTYTEEMADFIHRDGSLGAQILNRFKVILDYQNKRISLKPNRKFNEPFNYDMSGVAIAHSGYISVKKHNKNPVGNNSWVKTEGINYFFKPEYEIVEIRPQSPAEKAGLKVGDVVKKINGKSTLYLSLEDISSIFSSEEGKMMRLKIDRGGVEYIIAFKLKRIL